MKNLNGLKERRKYQRCDNVICEAEVLADGEVWNLVELQDISAGGLGISSDQDFRVSDRIVVRLTVYNMLSEFRIKLTGDIIRIDTRRGKPVYVMKYEGISRHTQVLLDELVHSGRMVRHGADADFNEEYSALLLPGISQRQRRPKRGNSI